MILPQLRQIREMWRSQYPDTDFSRAEAAYEKHTRIALTENNFKKKQLRNSILIQAANIVARN